MNFRERIKSFSFEGKVISSQFQSFWMTESFYKFINGLGMICIIAVLIAHSNHVFAADLLAGTDTDIKDTMEGTGKHWLYWIDGGVSLASFVYSKKPIVFFSVLGISLFITALVKLAAG